MNSEKLDDGVINTTSWVPFVGVGCLSIFIIRFLYLEEEMIVDDVVINTTSWVPSVGVGNCVGSNLRIQSNIFRQNNKKINGRRLLGIGHCKNEANEKMTNNKTLHSMAATETDAAPRDKNYSTSVW